jgi:hypothetical protein
MASLDPRARRHLTVSCLRCTYLLRL